MQAHDTGSAGSLEIVFGWEIEPAYSGLTNAVHVAVFDEDGDPVDDPSAQLTVTVTYGNLAITRPLVALDEVGTFNALLVPTQPGIYAFQLMGTVGGESVDLTSTCSDETFDCVSDASEVLFPGEGISGTTNSDSPVVTVPPHDGGNSVDAVTITALVLATLACIGVGLLGLGAWRPKRAK